MAACFSLTCILRGKWCVSLAWDQGLHEFEIQYKRQCRAEFAHIVKRARNVIYTLEMQYGYGRESLLDEMRDITDDLVDVCQAEDNEGTAWTSRVDLLKSVWATYEAVKKQKGAEKILEAVKVVEIAAQDALRDIDVKW